MDVICLEEKAFYALMAEVIEWAKAREGVKEDKWIGPTEAMTKLRIKSKTTLQRLRDEGKIRFSQPDKKIILYDVDSINAYLEKNTREPF